MQLPDTTGWTFTQRINWLNNCTPEQWDAICRRCGKCCLKKIDMSNWGISGVYYTFCACEYLDLKTRQCKIYSDRFNHQKNCERVTLDKVLRGEIVPASCAYVEILYGPAQSPATVDWDNVINTPDDSQDLSRMVCNIIMSSNHWNRHT